MGATQWGSPTSLSNLRSVNQKLFGTDDLKATSMMDNTFLNFEDQEYEEQTGKIKSIPSYVKEQI